VTEPPRHYLSDDLGKRLLDEWERGTEVAERDEHSALTIWLSCWAELPDAEIPWFEREYDFPIAAVLCQTLAEAYLHQGVPDAALEHARRLTRLSTNPVDTSPHVVLGMAARDAGRDDEALRSFATAHEIGGPRAFRGYPSRYWQFFRESRRG